MIAVVAPYQPPAQEQEQEEEEEQKATSVELFSDLVFVVAMHVVAEPLESAPALWDGKLVLLVYILRVFVLWWLWHATMMWTNLANLLFVGDDLRPSQHVVIFVIMGCVITLSQAAKEDDHSTVLTCYVIARTVLTLAWRLEAAHPQPLEMSQDRYDFLMKICRRAPLFTFVTELLPLSVAAWLLRGGELNAVGLIMWVGSHVLILACRTLTTSRIGAEADERARANYRNPFASGQIAERYELIMLIVTGEIVFASAVPGPRAYSLEGFVVTCLCFLLYFKARPESRELSFAIDGAAATQAPHVHFLLLCALPGIGAGYARLSHSAHAAGATGSHARQLHGVDSSSCTAPTLLYGSASVFLIGSALVALMNRDGKHAECRYPRATRLAPRLVTGLIAAVLVLTHNCDGPTAASAIPVLLALPFAFEMWALGHDLWEWVAEWTSQAVRVSQGEEERHRHSRKHAARLRGFA